jgi:hypothetical protein
MRSSLIIRGEPLAQNKSLTQMMDCMASLTVLSVRLSCPISVTMQHNIREDHFVVVAEARSRTFGHHGKNFEEVFKKLRKEVDKELNREELRTAKKQAAREESSTGRWGKNAKRERVQQLRQG